MDDIKYVLNPTFTTDQISNLDKSDKLSRAIDGTMYLPGIVGLNNIKANDYCNVVLQVIAYSRILVLMRRLLRNDFIPGSVARFTFKELLFEGGELRQS